MTQMRPVMFVWTDEGTMVPDARFKAVCDKQFVVGIEYPLIVVEPRNMKSHNHYFAALHEAWLNLSEEDTRKYPTEEHLRAWALIECGFFAQREIECEKPALAKRMALLARQLSPMARIGLKGSKVVVMEAASQSLAAMGPDAFKASKEAVLDLVTGMAGTTRKELAKAADQHAPREREQKPKAADRPAPSNQLPMPKDAPQYFAYARAWIFSAKQTLKEKQERWETERQMRDDLRVSIANRSELENMLDHEGENAQ